MTQPTFVPIASVDQVRPALQLEVHGGWKATRPGEVRFPARPGGPTLGAPGPDQGFALRLARRFEHQLVLVEGESAEDVMLGCALLASRRAGLFGRAPCIHDLNVAFGLFSFVGAVEPGLAAERAARFRGLSHDYSVQRRLVDSVPEELIRLSPAVVQARAGALRELLSGGVGASPAAEGAAPTAPAAVTPGWPLPPR